MTEALEIITDALQMILVQADEEPIEGATAQSAIRALNRMMDRYSAEGINLGYTTVTNLSSEITVPAGAIDGMVSNLAVILAPQYIKGWADPITIGLARSGKNAMRNIAVTISASEFSNNLPLGSGTSNSDDNGRHFYPDREDDILAETPGSISQEDGTYEDVNP